MAWFDSSYLFKKQITIDHTKVSGGANLTNFPVLISRTDVNLKTVGNGGSVQNASGFDIIFTDSTETTKLDHEIERYVASTGEIEMWVRIPTLSASVDTIIYLYYDNNTIVSTQENKAAVWTNANYTGVWHLSETSGNNADSSGNGNNFTNVVVTSRGVAAKVAGGNTLNGSTDVEQTTGSNATQLPANFTLSGWVNISSLTANSILVRKAHGVAPWQTYYFYITTAGHLGIDWINTLSTTYTTTGTSTLVTGTWYYVAATFNNTTKVLQVYVNGVADQAAPTTATGTAFASTDTLQLSNSGTPKMTGTQDEMRLASDNKTVGWLATEVANQNAPTTFITVSAVLTPGATLSATIAGLGSLTATLATNTVTRSGAHLVLNGATFRFSGPNIYWLGLAEMPTVHYPSQFEINDALITAKEMGATVVRAHTLGISVGSALSIEPSLGSFNDAAFDPIDYAIKRAGELSLKLIIPLVDNWHFYFGGKHTFTDWRALADETLFYTNATVIADFEAYISHVLSHTNTYTGVTFVNDPTIMAWETGNELYSAPATWTNTITTYIKSIDSMHLVLTGDTVQNAATGAVTTELAEANLDLFTDHYYPPDTSIMATNQAAVTPSSKVYMIGEYDWTDQDDAAATFSIDATTAHTGTDSAKIIVSTPSLVNAWHVQLLQSSFALAISTYTVSFWAKSSVGRTLEILIQENHDAFTIYTQQTVTLTTSWALYTLTPFTMTATEANALIAFDCASVASTIWIDDVNINNGGANLLTNPGFESGVFTPWTTKVVPSSTLAAFLSAIESNTNIAGDLFWTIYPHDDSHGFVIHNDLFSNGQFYTYSLYYPGQSASQQTNAQALRSHAYAMSGLSTPAQAIPVAPSNITVSMASPNLIISWQGVMGAATYQLERSTTGANGSFTIVGSAYTDFSTPVTDSGIPFAWYRIKAANQAGVYGPYSAVIGSLSLYGSNVAALTPNTAGKSATTIGGAEVAAVTTAPANGNGYVECFALGGVSTVSASLPPPSGKGWVLNSPLLEEQRLVTGNWSASVPVSDATMAGAINSYTIRFWQSAAVGTYALLGSIVLSAAQVISATRTVKVFPASLMPQTDFTYGDQLYIDFFINANGWASDVLSVYVSNSGSVGVAGDMEVDTAGYIPSGDAGVVTSYIPRALSALLIVMSTALSATASGIGTFSATFVQVSTLTCTIVATGQLSPQLSARVTLPTGTLAGSSPVTGTLSLVTSLSGVLSGADTLAGSVQLTSALSGTCTGVGVLSATFQETTALALTLVGNTVLTPTLGAAFALPGVVLAGTSALTSPLSAKAALVGTLVGGGQLTGTLQASAGAALSVTYAGVGILTPQLSAVETLSGSTLAGTSALIPTLTASFTLSGATTTGIGTLTAGAVQLSTALVLTGSGIGTLTAPLSATMQLAGGTLAGSGVLSGTLTANTPLTGALSGIGTSSSQLSATYALNGTSLAGIGTLAGLVSMATSLTTSLPGTSTLTPQFSAGAPLSTNLAGSGQLTGTVSSGGALSGLLAGTSSLTGTLTALLALSDTSSATGTLMGTLSAKVALNSTLAGVGSLTAATPALNVSWSGQLAGTSQLAGTFVLATYLVVIVPGTSSMTGTMTRTAVLTTVYTGSGSLNAAPIILAGGQLPLCILAGYGTLSTVFSYPSKSPTATWTTRDHSATWQTRDLAAVWKTRDLEDIWKEER